MNGLFVDTCILDGNVDAIQDRMVWAAVGLIRTVVNQRTP
jgi:hypothetical protein